MARLFGTDGVRGLANRDITAESALKLAQAAAIVLGEDARSRGQKPKAVIGRDPRISGEFLAAAISAGLSSSGVDVFDAGVLPTPAVAFLTADLDADFGVMTTRPKIKSKLPSAYLRFHLLELKSVTSSASPMLKIAT